MRLQRRGNAEYSSLRINEGKLVTMSIGCCNSNPKFDGMSPGFKRALWIVISLNGTMFLVEVIAGAFADSKALQADALDFLGDTVTYAMSLYVIGLSIRIRTRAALIKGVSLGAMGAWVFVTAFHQFFIVGIPKAEIMGGIGALALIVNLVSVFILMRYKDGDANVRSVWLCSRNDAIGNIAVLIASIGVLITSSSWPDLVVAILMAGLFSWSSAQIIRQALQEQRHARTALIEGSQFP